MDLHHFASTNESEMFVELCLHSEARSFEDEWSGVTDSNARRKLQNRLNQRAYRRRKAVERQGKENLSGIPPLRIQCHPSASCIHELSTNSTDHRPSATRRSPPSSPNLAAPSHFTSSLDQSSRQIGRSSFRGDGREHLHVTRSEKKHSVNLQTTSHGDRGASLSCSSVSGFDKLKLSPDISEAPVQLPGVSADHQLSAEKTSSQSVELNSTALISVQQHPFDPADGSLFNANFSEGDAVDPFSSSAIKFDKRTHMLFQYFLHIWVPTTFKEEIYGSSASFRHIPALVDVVQSSLADEMHMQSLLTVSAGHMKYVTHSPVARPNDPEVSMDKAIRSLRMYFQNMQEIEIDWRVILDINCLFVFECYRGNYPTAMIHLRAIAQFVNGLGGFDALDACVREHCWMGDVSISIATSLPPMFACTWDPGRLPLYPNIKAWEAAPRYSNEIIMGQGLLDLIGANFFVPETELASIASDVAEFVQVAQYDWWNSKLMQVDPKWMCKRQWALLYRLLSITEAESDASVQRQRNDCVKLTLVLLLSCFGSQLWAEWSARLLATRLRRAIDREGGGFATSWNNYDEVLLWVLATGTFAAEGTQEENWFVTRTQCLATKLGVDGCSLLKITGKYWCLKKPQQRSLMKLAAALGEKKGSHGQGNETSTLRRSCRGGFFYLP